MTPEKRIQNKVCKYLKQLEDTGHPLFWERRQAGGFAYKAGLPDIYFVYNGIHCEIEIKSITGSTSSVQDTWANKFKKLNINYICVNNIQDFILFVEKNCLKESQKM